MKEEYSPYKIVHNIDKLQELKEGKQTIPLQVQIVPTNRCNENCGFCLYRKDKALCNEEFETQDQLSFEKIVETLDCFNDMGVKAVSYTGGGSPLVHPQATDILKTTIDKKIELSLVTNGMALTEEQCELLGNYASWTRVSVDCATPETYEYLRQVPKKNFDRVINNIKTLIKYKKDCIIGVGFVVQEDNYKEIYDAAKLFKDIGVDNFRISAAFTPEGYSYFKDFQDEAKELSLKAQSLSDDNFTVFNLFNDRVKDTFEGKQDYDFCPIKELVVYIGADYNVYTCCTLAYNKKGLIGSIKDQSFKDLWFSQEKIDMYENHNPKVVCQHPCMFKGKNEFINYCIKKDAKHVNYI